MSHRIMSRGLSSADTNPEFFIEENEQEITIYSLLDSLIIGPREYGDNLPEFFIGIPDTKKKLTIFALNLTLAGKVAMPGGDMNIVCKNFGVMKRSDRDKDTPPALDACPTLESIYDPADARHLKNTRADGSEGKSGDDLAAILQEKGKKYGKKGTAGGSITLVCDRMTLEDECYLVACGSEGYPGFAGQNGAKGRTGADERVHVRTERYVNDRPPVAVTHYYFDGSEPPAIGGRGGRGGRGGKGGEGGDGGKVVVKTRVVDHLDRLFPDATGGPQGKCGEPGKGGGGGPGGRFHDYVAINSGEVHYKTTRRESGPSGPGGGHALPNHHGIDGLHAMEMNAPLARLGHFFDEHFFRRLLQRVKYWYLFNVPQKFSEGAISYTDDDNWKLIGETLAWMVEVLADFYEVENLDLAGARKNQILMEATNMLVNHRSDKTYFGTSADHVPRIMLRDVRANFEKAIDHREKLEQAYVDLAADFAKAREISFSKAQKIAHLTAFAAAYEEACDNLVEKIENQETVVRHTNFELQEALATMLEAGEAFRTAIRNNFDFELDKLCRGLEMLAFTGLKSWGGKAMGALQMVNFIYQGATTIQDSQGHSVPKKYLIDEFTEYEEDIVKNAVEDVMDYDGTYDETRLKGVFADVNKALKELKKIGDHINDKQAVKGELEALERVKTALFKKGEEIFTYNTYISQYYSNYKVWRETLENLEKLKNSKQILTPYRITWMNYYTQIYQSMIERTIRQLYLMNRKSYYLTFEDFFKEIDLEERAGGLWLNGERPSPNLMALVEKYDALKEKELDFFARQTSAYQPFPADPHKRSDIRLTLDRENHPELLEEFVRNRKLYFTTLPNRETPAVINQFHVGATKNKFNLRISHIMPRIVGAETQSRSGLIEVEIKHLGVSIFEGDPPSGTDGPLYRFSHVPVNCVLTHEQGTKVDGSDNADIGSGNIGQISDAHLDNVGLYGNWMLKIEEGDDPDSPNYQLDLSRISAIVIHFQGFNQVKNLRSMRLPASTVLS